MKTKTPKFKLKYKENRYWSLDGPSTVKIQNTNYYQALDGARKIVKSLSGELHIYKQDGSFKETINFS